MGRRKTKSVAVDVSDDALLDAAIAHNALYQAAIDRTSRPNVPQNGSTDKQLQFELSDRDSTSGLLPELSGRLFYDLITCMSVLAVPDLNERRKAMNLPLIGSSRREDAESVPA